jgi:outer membrane lipoprotein-sorting protein
VTHDDARRALSERMDGEHLSSRTVAALERHLAACESCRAFDAGAWRLREAARFGVAEPVPDLVSPIMRAVAAQASAHRLRRPMRAPGGRGRVTALGAVAASVAVGVIAGSLTVGGPWRPGDHTTLATAAEVSAGVAAAAERIDAYQATFAITESDPTGPAHRRDLTMSVAFRAPEQFRLDVTDHTPGADVRFAGDDLELIVNGDSSYQVAPSACPIGVCPSRERVVRNRLPFSSATPAPTDLILPVSTLVDAREMRVVRAGHVLGRDAIEVMLPFERARPLFPFLELGGRWRPFFPMDRVAIWLDRQSWFPLGYSVYPATGLARRAWELRFGMGPEPTAQPIFQVRAVSIDERAPGSSTFRIPYAPSPTNEGARAVSIDALDEAVRFTPVTPTVVDGLPLYRAIVPETERDAAVLTYSSGLSWLKLDETQASTGDAFFGPIGAHAREVRVAGLGTAFYDPASIHHGRRLAIHTADGQDLYLETNLSRQRLLAAAAALNISAAPLPATWLTSSSPLGETRRVTLDEAVTDVPFPLLVPASPPAGYTLTSVETVTVSGVPSVNLYFEADDGAAETGGLRLHEEAASILPPGSAPHEFTVTVRGVTGRWTPDRHQLEWVDDGVYYSLDGGGLELADLAAVADGLVPAVVPTPSGSAVDASPATMDTGSAPPMPAP